MYQFIDTQQALSDFVAHLKTHDWIAIDTEFIRERTYYPELCLIQIAAGEQMACIDPIALEDMSALFEVLNDPNIIKVFHAAQQDLEILYFANGKVPAPIFDTQPAASILGIGDQIGYAGLVEQTLGVSLAKAESRTDWSKRPLSDAQLDYAIDDVRYLQQMYPMLRDKLQAGGRLEWLSGDFDHLTSEETYQLNERERWQRVKGLQNLKAQQLSVLRELGAWRELEAAKRDRPRRWILSDDILVDLSRRMPDDSADMEAIRGVNPKHHQRYFDAWITAIEVGSNQPKDDWPVPKRRSKPSAELDKVAELLMVVVRLEADRQNISPAAVTSKKAIVKMLQEGDTSLSNDWRGNLVNPAIKRVLSGEMMLGIMDGKADLIEIEH